jgi:hypothetical protein
MGRANAKQGRRGYLGDMKKKRNKGKSEKTIGK